MNTLKLALASLVFVATALTLGACSEPSEKELDAEQKKIEGFRNDSTVEIQKKLKNGRTVTCLTYDSDGITCDWANAR